jgi:hypothetical protein
VDFAHGGSEGTDRFFQGGGPRKTERGLGVEAGGHAQRQDEEADK